MNVERGRLSGGAIVVPEEIRAELGLAEGDAVVMRVVDGALQVRSYRDVVRRIQERLAPYRPTDGTLVSEELIRERHAAAEHE